MVTLVLWRLTHRAPEALAGAVLFALALEEILRSGVVDGLAARLGGWTATAVRWGGAAPNEVPLAVRDPLEPLGSRP
jgi:hypothetical protein